MGVKKFFSKWFGKKSSPKTFPTIPLSGMPKDKLAVYAVGYSDPCCFKGEKEKKEELPPYSSVFSACDVKVYFNDKPVGILQGISFGYKTSDHRGGIVDGSIGGTCIFLLYDGKDHLEWLGKEAVISLVGANEYGKIATLYHAKVKFDEHEQFGVSIDDIVMEVTLDFTVLERYFTDYVRPKQEL